MKGAGQKLLLLRVIGYVACLWICVILRLNCVIQAPVRCRAYYRFLLPWGAYFFVFSVGSTMSPLKAFSTSSGAATWTTWH